MQVRCKLKKIAKGITKEHVWLEYDDAKKKAKFGITNYAQIHLGELVSVQLPNKGQKIDIDRSIVIYNRKYRENWRAPRQ